MGCEHEWRVKAKTSSGDLCQCRYCKATEVDPQRPVPPTAPGVIKRGTLELLGELVPTAKPYMRRAA